MMREAMSPRELTGILVRSGLQGVTLPEVPARRVKSRETMAAMRQARLDLAGPAAAGLRALHAPAVRVVRHGYVPSLSRANSVPVFGGEERSGVSKSYERWVGPSSDAR